MCRLTILVALSMFVPACDSRPRTKNQIESHNTDSTTSLQTEKKPMNRLDRVMGTLLETWAQRYQFEHDREEPKLTFQVPGFTLTVLEQGEGDQVAILFEEAGTKHKAICSVEEAPKIIEALLFPEPEGK